MQLLFATNNKNKIKEIASHISSKINLLGLEDIGCKDELPETQDTLEGNALQKARFVHDNYKVNCFSDDTGLEVEALDGRPGVYSARYAGEQKSAEDNMDKILGEMKQFENRKAKFRTVIALIFDGKEFLFEGFIEGKITYEKKGGKGFGYDPIFIPDGSQMTFAEMNLDEKNKISHRALAVNKLVNFLNDLHK